MAKKNMYSKKRKAAVQEPEVNLKRFAGSSGEEDNDDDSEEEEEIGEEVMNDEMEAENDVVKEEEVEEEEEEAEEEEEEADDNDDEVREAASGMANAMARILGTQPKKANSTASVILSKTTTPLQRQAAQEKERMKEMREKRRANRERNLTALHIPLSVATSRVTTTGGVGLVKELELERTHRRVATRGVVALFNAISQHQQQAKVDSVPTSKSEGNTDTKHMTKHGFLDMIKSAAKDGSSTKQQGKEKKGAASNAAAGSSKPQWNALKDDYMLGSKLKDWDKASSDEDDEDDEPVDDNWGDEEDTPSEDDKKRREVSAQ